MQPLLLAVLWPLPFLLFSSLFPFSSLLFPSLFLLPLPSLSSLQPFPSSLFWNRCSNATPASPLRAPLALVQLCFRILLIGDVNYFVSFLVVTGQLKHWHPGSDSCKRTKESWNLINPSTDITLDRWEVVHWFEAGFPLLRQEISKEEIIYLATWIYCYEVHCQNSPKA